MNKIIIPFNSRHVVPHDNIYLFGYNSEGIIKVNMNTCEIEQHICLPKEIIEDRGFIVSDDLRAVYINENNTIYKVNLITEEVKILEIFDDDIYLDYVSNDDRCIIISVLLENKGVIIIDGIIIHTFNSVESHIWNNSVYYLDNANITINKFDFSTEILTSKQINIDGGFGEYYYFEMGNGLIIINYDEFIDCYDDELEFKYRLKNVQVVGENYIVCRNDSNKKLWTIHSILDGSFVGEIKTNTSIDMNAIKICGELILLNYLYDVDSTGLLMPSRCNLVYEPSGKFIGEFIFDKTYDRQHIHISPNRKYLYVLYYGYSTKVDENDIKSMDYIELLKSFDIYDLFNTERKLEFLKGASSPESSIARTTTNPLFDEHLFGEIFDMIGATVHVS
jgi:hypothetical protein